MKKVFFVLIAALLLALFPFGAFAGFSGDNIEILTRLEASNNGTDWYNYSAETNSGGQTLEINAGDTVTFKVKMWNIGESDAQNIVMNLTSTNWQYVETANIFDGSAASNADLDGDTAEYTLADFSPSAGTATFNHIFVGYGTNETGDTNSESGTYTTKISSSTPDQTVITVTITVSTAEEARVIVGSSFLDRAMADDSATSVVRILVHNTTAQAATTTLPETGAHSTPVQSNNFWQLYLACAVLLLMVATPKIKLLINKK